MSALGRSGALVVLVAVQLSSAGIVSAAGVQIAVDPIISAPDDHFTAGPDRCVIASAIWCVAGAGGGPSIIGASSRRLDIVGSCSAYRALTLRRLIFRTARQFAETLSRRNFVLGRQIGYQTLCQHWSGQTLCDDKGIVPERFKEFTQHFGLFGVLCHSVHFSLQLLSSDRPFASNPPAPASCADNPRPSFPAAPETSPHRAMAWGQDSPLARCDDASKLPQWLVGKPHALRTSEFCQERSTALRAGRNPAMAHSKSNKQQLRKTGGRLGRAG